MNWQHIEEQPIGVPLNRVEQLSQPLQALLLAFGMPHHIGSIGGFALTHGGLFSFTCCLLISSRLPPGIRRS